MIHEILSHNLLNNSVHQYLAFLLILFGTIFATKLVYLIFKKIFRSIAKKTKSTLDDLLVNSLEKPVIFLTFIFGVYFGKNVLLLSEKVSSYYDLVMSTLIIISIVWFVLRIVDSIMLNYFHPKTSTKLKIDNTLYPMIKKLVNFAILVIAFLIIIQNLGYEITTLIAGLGIGGLAFALAAQDILSNLFGGFAILTDKPFKVGDRILVAGQDGFVKKIGLRTTIIETWGGTQIVMPNKQVADSVLENVTREKARRVRMVLGVEYGTATKKLLKAKKILQNIVLKNNKTDDQSLVHFVEFNASSLDIQLIYWIKDLEQILETKDEINFAIKDAFEKEKISFAFPSQTIHLSK